MRLGISSYTYVWAAGVPGYEQPELPLTAWSLLEKAIQLNVRLVQIAENLALGQLSLDDRRRFARQASESGISIEIGTAGIDRDRLLAGLSLAKEFNSPILRLLLDTASCHPSSDQVVAALSEVVPEFQQAQVVIAIENHDRFPAAILRQIVEDVNPRTVGICFDTANSIGCLESAEQVLDTLEPYIVNVHLKDYCIFRPAHHKGFIVEGRAAGQGQLDIPRLLSRLTRLAHHPNLILELWPPPQSSLAESIALEDRWAGESIQFLRRFVQS